ncbi:MAG TPA: hypothetical protein VK066_01955 [Chloroflexota bacterium]|nr:hypothetical protein [Chloroflexota bacterium]
MWIDVEELWPAAKDLVGLRFATEEDFQKCWLLALEQPEAFRLTLPESLAAEVRKTHKHLVDEAGLTYSEYKIVDLDELPTEERLRQEREAVQYGMKILLERMRRENGA